MKQATVWYCKWQHKKIRLRSTCSCSVLNTIIYCLTCGALPSSIKGFVHKLHFSYIYFFVLPLEIHVQNVISYQLFFLFADEFFINLAIAIYIYSVIFYILVQIYIPFFITIFPLFACIYLSSVVEFQVLLHVVDLEFLNMLS